MWMQRFLVDTWRLAEATNTKASPNGIRITNGRQDMRRIAKPVISGGLIQHEDRIVQLVVLIWSIHASDPMKEFVET